jgi:hypothetical protein
LLRKKRPAHDIIQAKTADMSLVEFFFYPIAV